MACLENSCCGCVSYVQYIGFTAVERIPDLHPRGPGSESSAQSSMCSCTRADRTDRTVPGKCRCRNHCTAGQMHRLAEHWWCWVKALDRTGGSDRNTECKNRCYQQTLVTLSLSAFHTSLQSTIGYRPWHGLDMQRDAGQLTRNQAKDREWSNLFLATVGLQTRNQYKHPRAASVEADRRKSQRSKSPQ